MRKINLSLRLSVWLNFIGYTATLFGFALLFLISFILILAFHNHFNKNIPHVDYEVVIEKGEDLNGKVKNIEFKTNITSNGKHPAIVDFTFIQNDSLRHSRVYSFNSTSLDTLEPNNIIQLKEFNNQIVAVGLPPIEVPIFAYLVNIIAFLICFSLVYILNKRNKSIFELYKKGNLKTGKITSIRKKMLGSEFRAGILKQYNPNGYFIEYEYKDSNGESQFGNSFSLKRPKRTKSGSKIKILVNPNNEVESTIFPIKGLK